MATCMFVFEFQIKMQRGSRSRSRRLMTPDPVEPQPRLASGQIGPSRSHTCHDGIPEYCRSHVSERRSSDENDRLRLIEQEMERERERLRRLQHDLDRERSLLRRRRTVSNRDFENHNSVRNTGVEREIRSRRRERSVHDDEDCPERQRSRIDERDASPSFRTKDVVNLLNSIKQLQSQPSTSVALPPIHSNHKNILPDFDPSSKNQRIDVWLKKVNECATVYGWDEKTTVHFAMQKLQGLAKIWYESLPSILFNWTEWQDKLTSAFPCEQNYGQTLEDMLRRKSKFNEPIELYYYEKLALLNQCDIQGKRAVDCIVHGLTDKTIRSSAVALRCSHPEQLLKFLMSNKESSQPFDRVNKFRSGTDTRSASSNNTNKVGNKTSVTQSNLTCYNCKEKGHPFLKCPKPITKCDKCHKMGHKTENCFSNGKDNKGDAVHKTMRISGSNPSSKFYKEIDVNNVPMKGFVDFGSEVSLIRQSNASSLGLPCSNETTGLKGFGNEIVRTLGSVAVNLSVDGVNANVICQVVDDQYLELPLLIGQSFTEQSHVAVYKTAEKLSFFDIGREMPFSETDIRSDVPIRVSASADVEIYGPASIKAIVDPLVQGSVWLDSKIIGKPLQQIVILGSVYPVKNQVVSIVISPMSEHGYLEKGVVISRGLEVSMVNLITPSKEQLGHTRIDRANVRIGDSVDESQRQNLFQLLDKYQHCFAFSLRELGCTSVTEMTIELNSKRPVVYRPYRLSHKERENVREMVGDMLDAGIVRESVSEYASPIILVRKKDGKQRMCVDYRMLNSLTIKERYPMPNIDDEIARLSGQTYFVTLDLTSGYYQVPISEQSRPLTSFVTPDGQYEFNRMPFGLANAPAVFQRMMNKVLGPVRYDGATAYIDDVLIYGKNVEECLTRLENVLQLLENANLTLNLEKCEFLKDKIDYLGYEISAAGVRPGSKKIQCVLDFPCPTDQHTGRQFLGLVGYFRKFIRNFASLADPLTKLLTKNVVWTWTSEQEEAFKTLKSKLLDRPILAIYI